MGTPEFLSMMRLRKIWAEGSFSVLKREHCISKIRKRGILAATEECLLAVMALNLKRMANAIFFISIFTILPIPLRVSAEFLPLSTGPILDTTQKRGVSSAIYLTSYELDQQEFAVKSRLHEKAVRGLPSPSSLFPQLVHHYFITL